MQQTQTIEPFLVLAFLYSTLFLVMFVLRSCDPIV